jgi:hypothetical protein
MFKILKEDGFTGEYNTILDYIREEIGIRWKYSFP